MPTKLPIKNLVVDFNAGHFAMNHLIKQSSVVNDHLFAHYANATKLIAAIKHYLQKRIIKVLQ